MPLQPQSQMESYRTADSYRRDGRVVIARYGTDAIQTTNRQLTTIDGLAKAMNPDAMLAPQVTDIVGVHDIVTQSFHAVLLHRLDYRPQPASAIGNVVVFSKPAYAPGRTKTLQLATPAYYRDQGDLKPGIRDRDDGTLTRDGTQWASSIMGGTVSARLSFASYGEPWVYCASHYRTNSELRRLRNEFGGEFGYSAATRIDDPDAFALWLAVDFALALDKTADVSLGPVNEIAYALRSYTANLWDGSLLIDTFVQIYYGPVNYEDVSGRVDRQEQWFDPNASPKAWFTKKASFNNQSEYRFAVTTPGTPMQLKHYVAVSPELRALTSTL